MLKILWWRPAGTPLEPTQKTTATGPVRIIRTRSLQVQKGTTSVIFLFLSVFTTVVKTTIRPLCTHSGIVCFSNKNFTPLTHVSDGGGI